MATQPDSENDLLTAPVGVVLRRLAVPTSVGFFFHTMYNVVDTFFAGMISTEALAALSLSFPVFFLMISLAIGISTGATALIANALGEGDIQRAKLFSAQALSYSILVAAIVTALGLTFSPHLFGFLGAKDQYLEMVLAYMDLILWGSVSFLLADTLNSILVAKGQTKPFRNFLVASFFLNVVLDPWFLYGGFGVPPLGIRGIALATVLIQSLGCVYLGIKAHQTGLLDLQCCKMTRPNKQAYIELSAQGLPASLNMMTVALGVFIITYYVKDFGEQAVAAYGAAMRIEQIALLPCIGLNMAALTAVGRSNGAKLFDRVRQIWLTGIGYGIAVTVPGMVLVYVFAPAMMGWFSDDPNVIVVGVDYLRIDVLVFCAYTILFLSVATLQGLKRPMYAVWLGAFRQIAGPLVLIPILVHQFDLGIFGIWWGIVVITWSAAIFTLIYTKRQIHTAATRSTVS